MGLAGALVQIFAVIGLGYFGLRSGYLSQSASSGFKQLVGKVGMPALLFEAIATSDLGLLQARVILAMLLSKLIVMALAVVVGMRYDDKSPRRASTGGVFGMFVVNSLDLALGIPLMKALYPQYIVTLYFFEIVTSLVLVPVCMGFCE